MYNKETDSGERPTYRERYNPKYVADLDLFMKELAEKTALGDQAEIDPKNGLPVLNSFLSETDFSETQLGNLTGFKYAPTGAINLRLYAEQNRKVYSQLKNFPMQPDGSVQQNELSVDEIQQGGRKFYETTINTMKRFPGMVPITAPFGINGVDHLSPGYPFFSYAIKRCPGNNPGNDCCMVVEGDANIDDSDPEGKLSATDKLTRLRASKLFSPDGGQTEYRARWNIISSHTSFSRVVPDIGSYDSGKTKKGQMWYGDFIKKLPKNDAQEDVSAAFNNPQRHMYPPNQEGKNSFASEKKFGNRVWGNSANGGEPTNLINGASPKCFWQRTFPGARERVAAMFLEHCTSLFRRQPFPSRHRLTPPQQST